MSEENIEHMIVAGIRHLPPDRQREVADFVYFLRQRDENNRAFVELIEADLAEFEAVEIQHLEEEFPNYDSTHSSNL